MKHPQLFLTALSLSCCFCAGQEQSHGQTFADLQAAVARNTAHYEQSQLTQKPDQYLDNSDLIFSLFFKLPLPERVVYIMHCFSGEELDGEYAERMGAMLLYRTQPETPWGGLHPRSAKDKIYTRAIFRTIDGYSQTQLRSFCQDSDGYALFKKNLKGWRDYCKLWQSL